MRERYRKVLIQKLEEYLPSDVATQMLEADLEGKHTPLFLSECVWGGGGSTFFMKIMVPRLNPCPLVKMSTKLPL